MFKFIYEDKPRSEFRRDLFHIWSNDRHWSNNSVSTFSALDFEFKVMDLYFHVKELKISVKTNISRLHADPKRHFIYI